jgi:hypothetical protein
VVEATLKAAIRIPSSAGPTHPMVSVPSFMIASRLLAPIGVTALQLLTNHFLALYCKGVVRAFGRTPQQNAPTTIRSFCQPTQKEAPTVHPPDGPVERHHPLECKPLDSVWHPSQGAKREYSAD